MRQTIRNRTRQRLNRIFQWAETRTSAAAYHRVLPQGSAEYAFEYVKPRYFRDIDSLAALLTELTKRGIVRIDGIDEEITPVNAAAIATQIANRAIALRQTIGIYADGAYIRLTQPNTYEGASTRVQPAKNEIQPVCDALEAHTDTLTRSAIRRKKPLIEPIHADDDARNRHDLEVAEKARKSGALWGSITGIGGAVAVFAVDKLFLQ